MKNECQGPSSGTPTTTLEGAGDFQVPAPPGQRSYSPDSTAYVSGWCGTGAPGRRVRWSGLLGIQVRHSAEFGLDRKKAQHLVGER